MTSWMTVRVSGVLRSHERALQCEQSVRHTRARSRALSSHRAATHQRREPIMLHLMLIPGAAGAVFATHGACVHPVPPFRMSASVGPCESPTWPRLKEELDKIPVFTVANDMSQPLQYQMGERQLAVFYVDVAAGKNEYENARDTYPDRVRHHHHWTWAGLPAFS